MNTTELLREARVIVMTAIEFSPLPRRRAQYGELLDRIDAALAQGQQHFQGAVPLQIIEAINAATGGNEWQGDDSPRELMPRAVAAITGLAQASPTVKESLTAQPHGAPSATDAEVIARCQQAGIRWIPPDDNEDGFPGGFDMTGLAEIRRLLAAAPAVPAGYKLVPVEPTPAMCAAGFVVSEAEHDPAGVYRAMLAAAPDVK